MRPVRIKTLKERLSMMQFSRKKVPIIGVTQSLKSMNITIRPLTKSSMRKNPSHSSKNSNNLKSLCKRPGGRTLVKADLTSSTNPLKRTIISNLSFSINLIIFQKILISIQAQR